MKFQSFRLFILLQVLVASSFAQIPTINPFFSKDTVSASRVTPLQLTKLGDILMDNNWNAGNIYLKNGDSLIAYYMRYDLVKNQVEIIIGNEIKYLNGSMLTRFNWFSADRLRPESFISDENIPFEDKDEENYTSSHYVQVLQGGPVKLLKRIKLVTNFVNAGPTLYQGNSEKVRRIIDYYLLFPDDIVKLSNGKRKNMEIINHQSTQRYIKKNNLKFSNEADLVKIVRYLNQNTI